MISIQIGANAQQWDIFRNTVALIESGGKYDILVDLEIIMMVYQMGELAKIDGSKIAGVEYPGHSDDPNNQLEQHIEQILNTRNNIYSIYCCKS